MNAGPSVVAIGGGTGLPIVLKAAMRYASDITAVVTVADDGGSSGRLRRDLGILPPGDIRNCLLALADESSPLAGVFNYRFTGGQGIVGHALGNLIIAALTEVRGDFAVAIDEAGKMLDIKGRVLPSTLADVTLNAVTARGGRVVGQKRIARMKKPIGMVALEPADPPAYEETVEAILRADQVIVGPGSLYTSILPNLLVPQVLEAVRESRARKIFVMNSMTQEGETSLLSATDHITALRKHCGDGIIDVVIANVADGEAEGLGPATGKRHLIRPCVDTIEAIGIRVIVSDVACAEDPGRHDPDKLATVLAQNI